MTRKKIRLTFEVPQKDSDDPIRSGIAGEWNPDMGPSEKLYIFIELMTALMKHEIRKAVLHEQYLSSGSGEKEARFHYISGYQDALRGDDPEFDLEEKE